MNKERQRKLDARIRRQESLASFGMREQGPKLYEGKPVDEEKLERIYRHIGFRAPEDGPDNKSSSKLNVGRPGTTKKVDTKRKNKQGDSRTEHSKERTK